MKVRKRKTYKDYPDYYFQLVEHFETSTIEFVVEGTWGELTSTRHKINRFFQTLFRDADSDDYARQLARTAEKLRLSISPGRAQYSDPAIMVAKLDPLYRAMINVHGGSNKK